MAVKLKYRIVAFLQLKVSWTFWELLVLHSLASSREPFKDCVGGLRKNLRISREDAKARRDLLLFSGRGYEALALALRRRW
jgi:hypothetical protein